MPARRPDRARSRLAAGLAAVAVAIATTVVLTATTSGAVAAAATATARVTYLAGASVYVDAGSADGVAEGDTLDVLRDGALIGRVRVVVVTTRRASADTLWTVAPLTIGDRVRFASRLAEAFPSESTATRSDAVPVVPSDPGAAAGGANGAADARDGSLPASSRAARSRRAWRGRVVASVLSLEDRQGGAGRLTRPTLDVSAHVDGAAGGRLDLAVDVRGRNTSRRLPDGVHVTEARARVYALRAALHDPVGRSRLVVGRQYSGALSSVSLFDGALVERRFERWSLGAFGGTQPGPDRLEPSGQIAEFGVFGERRSPAGSSRRWSVAGGGVSSRDRGRVNRDYLFLQSSANAGRLAVWLLQEADVNRGWRRWDGTPGFELTSTLATVRLELTRRAHVNAGYDGRRSVRLYRDRLTPETDFDDRYRQGAWVGGGIEPRSWMRATLEGRWHDASVSAGSWTATSEARAPGRWHPTARGRWSQYRSDRGHSELVSLALEVQPWGLATMACSGGTRTTTDRVAEVSDRVEWIEGQLDVAMGRGFAAATLTEERGAIERLRGMYGSVGWRW